MDFARGWKHIDGTERAMCFGAKHAGGAAGGERVGERKGRRAVRRRGGFVK